MNALKRMMTAGGTARLRVVAAGGLLVLAWPPSRGVSPLRHPRLDRRCAGRCAHRADWRQGQRQYLGDPGGRQPGGQGRPGVAAHRPARLPGASRPGHAPSWRPPKARRRGADAGVPLTNATTASVTAAAGAQLAAANADHARAAADYDRASSSELAWRDGRRRGQACDRRSGTGRSRADAAARRQARDLGAAVRRLPWRASASRSAN